MIRRIYIDNYKCLVNFELELEQLSLFLGANGTGKTSVLDVIDTIARLLRGELRLDASRRSLRAFPATTLNRWQQDRPLQTFELDVELDFGTVRYRLEIQHQQEARKARIWHESLIELPENAPLFRFAEGEVQLYRDDHSSGPVYSGDWSQSALGNIPPRHDNKKLTAFLQTCQRMLVCGIDPWAIGAEATAEDPLLGRRAENFASWLRHRVQEDPAALGVLCNRLQEVLPGLRDIRLPLLGRDARVVELGWSESGTDTKLYLDELSEGQRALVVLYALLAFLHDRTTVLFLDEPENFVALPEIQPWLAELQEACGPRIRQAVLCSHHPELINYLGPDSGIFFHRETGGMIRAKRASELVQPGDVLPLAELLARGWETWQNEST